MMLKNLVYTFINVFTSIPCISQIITHRWKLFHITCSYDDFVWVVVHKTSYAIQDTQSVHVNLIKDYHIILAVIKFRKLISITHRYREKPICRYRIILYVL